MSEPTEAGEVAQQGRRSRLRRVFALGGAASLPLIVPYLSFVGETANGRILERFGVPSGMQDDSFNAHFLLGVALTIKATLTQLVGPVLVGIMFLAFGLTIARTLKDVWLHVPARYRERTTEAGNGVGRRIAKSIKGTVRSAMTPMYATPVLLFGFLVGLQLFLFAFGAIMSVGFDEGDRMAYEMRQGARVCSGVMKPLADGAVTECVAVGRPGLPDLVGVALPTKDRLIIVDGKGLAVWLQGDIPVRTRFYQIKHPQAPKLHPAKNVTAVKDGSK